MVDQVQPPEFKANQLPPSGQRPQASTPFPAAAGDTMSSPNGIGISAAPETEDSAFKAQAKMSMAAVGNSGTQIFGGYFSEEYLSELRGREAARKFDEMRRSEAQIAMLMNAITNPIKAANWDFEAYDESNPDFKMHSDFIEMLLKEMIDFTTFVNEALTLMPFGFSLFEVVHNVVNNHPKFGTFNGLKAIAFRSQKTIENWQLEIKTGALLGVNQYTFSDLGGNEFIPGEFLLVFTHAKEGDNYEGISVLRPMYGPYVRKNLYLKLAAIGLEKYAVGTPIGTVPAGKERSPEFAEFQAVLENYTSHETAYIIKPQGWDITIEKGDFDADKIKELLVFENGEMVNSMVANFLILGMNGSGGAYSLGSNLGEFFTSGIQSYADLVCDGVNRFLIPNLIKLNFGPQPGYPKMKCTGISDKAGKDLAETIKFLSDSRLIDPDMPLKEWLRKQYKMPKPDVNTAIAMPAIPAGAAANYPKPNDPVVDPKTGKIIPFSPNQLDSDPTNDKVASAQAKFKAPPPVAQPGTVPAPAVPGPTQLSDFAQSIRLADPKYVKKFDDNKDGLKALMQENLTDIYQGLKDVLRKKYASLKGSSKILAAKGIEAPGVGAYKIALRNYLGQVAADSIQQARKQIPGGNKIKLVEQLASIKLAAPQGSGYYDALPPAVRNLVDAQASLVAETQASDIEKQVFFQFTSTATTTDDIDTIFNDVDNKVEPSIEGSTKEGMSVDVAAGDAVAHVTQQASLSFFFDDDVLDGIESFTFTNEDPVSDICTELAGQTFAVGDPDLDRYTPPLHHNCKSRLVPNLKGDSDNPDIDTGVSVSQKALKSITLGESCTHRITLGECKKKPKRKIKRS
jgi:phage gp29-like protein